MDEIGRWAREDPSGLALIDADRRVSFGDFARDIAAVRGALAPLGLPAGRPVFVVADPIYDAWRIVRAARSLGLTTVPARDVAQAVALEVPGACAVLTDRGTAARQRLDAAALPAPLIVAPDRLDPAALAAAPPPAPDEGGPPPGGHVLYTSGTTGRYKKILLDGPGEAARNLFRAGNSGHGRTTLAHVQGYGLWTGIGFKTPASVWAAGGAVVIDQRPDAPSRLLAHAPNYCQILPEHLRRLVEARGEGAAPAEGLELLVAGGFLPIALARAALARVSTDVRAHYGATELFGGVMQQPFRGEPDDLSWLTPNPERGIEVADEAGRRCPDGVEGELRVRLEPADVHAYWLDEAATARTFRDGWFHPGDWAVRRADGRIRVLGRAADVINVAGQKMATAPIERRLEAALGVEEVCLFSRLADDGTEEVVVAVQARGGPDPDDLARRLGPSASFGRVRVAVFEAFPRTTGGTSKTDRIALRRLVFG